MVIFHSYVKLPEANPIWTHLIWPYPIHAQDDGMYALAVIDWLVAQHNEVVQIVAGGRDYLQEW